MKTTTDLTERAKKLAGNWRKFESFAWWGRDDDSIPDPENWAILYTHNRDSGLLTQSNAATIAKLMEKHVESGGAQEIECSHWACGWISGYAVRCLHPEGMPTAAVAEWLEIQDRLENYPILDEDDYSIRETDATWENVTQQVKSVASCNGWTISEGQEAIEAVYNWLDENKPGELENRDDQGGWPSDDAIEEAFEALGYVQDSD